MSLGSSSWKILYSEWKSQCLFINKILDFWVSSPENVSSITIYYIQGGYKMVETVRCKTRLCLQIFKNLLSIFVQVFMGGLTGALAGGFLGLLIGIFDVL